MSKIFFMQNHVEPNTPLYALPLIKKLAKEGHEVLIAADSNLNMESDALNLRKIYSEFHLSFFNDFDDAKELLDSFSPNLYLTDLTAPRKKTPFRTLHKYAKTKYKVLEMDNRATEVLAILRKNWWYNAQFSPFTSYRRLGLLKYKLKRQVNKFRGLLFYY